MSTFIKLGSRRIELLPNKHLPPQFCVAVRLLRRPYIPISEAQYNNLYAAAGQHHTDVVRLTDGRQATFGNADQGWALMPLVPNWEDRRY